MRPHIAIVVFVLALAGCDRSQPAAPTPPAPETSALHIGRPFQLVDTQGRPVNEKALLGKPSAVFFGFTYCPEVCPTTLSELTAALAALGPEADDLNVVFISVDPERDTPAQLKLYLSNFDSRIKGFTGSVSQSDAAAKAFRVYHQKVPTDGGGYTVDHSSVMYLLDRQGRFVTPVRYGTPQDELVRRLRELIRHV